MLSKKCEAPLGIFFRGPPGQGGDQGVDILSQGDISRNFLNSGLKFDTSLLSFSSHFDTLSQKIILN